MSAWTPTSTPATVLCCECGSVLETPNAANMCVQCLRAQVDITQSIPKQVHIQQCKSCLRYSEPPDRWIIADTESAELLSHCLKKLGRGLTRVKLINARFIWTEPHSRRLKVQLTVQGEVYTGVILEQSFVIEYVVNGGMCHECHRQEADITWSAVAQVRQRVAHKRTFFWLEQLILKHNAHRDCFFIKETADGLDFYFGNRAKCKQLVSFLQSLVPLRVTESKKLISYDEQNNVHNYKFAFSVSIAPVCKDDLVCLPPRVAARHGNIAQVVLVTRITGSMHVVDPITLTRSEIQGTAYWRDPFNSLATSRALIPFIVLDISPIGDGDSHGVLADVEVARGSDLGLNDTTFLTRTHLGHLLKVGDTVLGYDLASMNFNDDNFMKMVNSGSVDLPDVYLVKKAYPNRRKKKRQRLWKLKHLTVERDDEEGNAHNRTGAGASDQHLFAGGGGGGSSRSRAARRGGDTLANDYEKFLRELEEDPSARAEINLYQDKKLIRSLIRHRHQQQPALDDEVIAAAAATTATASSGGGGLMDDGADGEIGDNVVAAVAPIPSAQPNAVSRSGGGDNLFALLDVDGDTPAVIEFDEAAEPVDETDAAVAAVAADAYDDDDDEEFPEVKLSELLNDLALTDDEDDDGHEHDTGGAEVAVAAAAPAASASGASAGKQTSLKSTASEYGQLRVANNYSELELASQAGSAASQYTELELSSRAPSSSVAYTPATAAGGGSSSGSSAPANYSSFDAVAARDAHYELGD
eukprot:CAMPEP_0198335952 /NCGR_PEP_ID=MMETSP1450-20131203/20654_1 /TAXON_ID=753684 ORGANISM="Madagascaria erythrocladiodes, Strain CCMP3234" /NCGR_SAMPLE_ID=MMETSP1450 /ASSEMBLY_ACC=CAM_ASM_001115 /LENGTH=753 /DNA_ID=CAMNT_0044040647 /DNA_START=100 /DNA_END=2359 /DNA_ORIENTATION=-